ncbi:MAG TPA: glycine C-acetyltransferase [candidate division Zixibacteria bacterium]|nr:glycine C-acetyltransferase [candidate division Zixibacteria bacterium]HBZ00875.1 glycine C-acetyltransferase [candidate division Zixibacteria bacterium]
MSETVRDTLNNISTTLAELKNQGLFKEERIITSPQGAEITVAPGREVINMCANNYLGLGNHTRLIEAAKRALDTHGFGLSSVRFICGTQDLHKRLEDSISEFLGTADTILFSSCFDANGGLFEAILGGQDAIISDALNHASIIDGIRLCKAERYRYEHSDMRDLELQLEEADKNGAKIKLIATDGVFSMDGDIAKLDQIVEIAHNHGAMTMVDDSHATGFLGRTGRGSIEHCGVMGKIDIITTTLGKALGGASGGCVSGRREIIAMLRQKARPYLFSNTLPPVIVAAGIEVFNILWESTELRDRLERNTQYFRTEMTEAGFDIKPGIHPIVPIMFGRFPNDARLAQDFARDMLEEGIYVIGFFYPVVPKGQSRIRVQISAAHSTEQLDRAVNAFKKIGKRYGVIN